MNASMTHKKTLSNTHTHTHIHTHKNTHLHTHTRTHSNTHTYTQTHTHTYTTCRMSDWNGSKMAGHEKPQSRSEHALRICVGTGCSLLCCLKGKLKIFLGGGRPLVHFLADHFINFWQTIRSFFGRPFDHFLANHFINFWQTIWSFYGRPLGHFLADHLIIFWQTIGSFHRKRTRRLCESNGTCHPSDSSIQFNSILYFISRSGLQIYCLKAVNINKYKWIYSYLYH